MENFEGIFSLAVQVIIAAACFFWSQASVRAYQKLVGPLRDVVDKKAISWIKTQWLIGFIIGEAFWLLVIWPYLQTL